MAIHVILAVNDDMKKLENFLGLDIGILGDGLIMKKVYNNFGVEIIEKEGKLLLRYDAGEIAVQINEIPISKEEALEIQKMTTSQKLYEYLIRNMNDRMVL